jgi:hypothetical protein
MPWQSWRNMQNTKGRNNNFIDAEGTIILFLFWIPIFIGMEVEIFSFYLAER